MKLVQNGNSTSRNNATRRRAVARTMTSEIAKPRGAQAATVATASSIARRNVFRYGERTLALYELVVQPQCTVRVRKLRLPNEDRSTNTTGAKKKKPAKIRFGDIAPNTALSGIGRSRPGLRIGSCTRRLGRLELRVGRVVVRLGLADEVQERHPLELGGRREQDVG